VRFDPDTRQYDAASTGISKSWLACALGHKACRDNRSALYQRLPKLFSELAVARGDGRYARFLRTLARADLLILDDWGLEPLNAEARHDLLEILEERYGRRSTIVTSQLPVQQWHEVIGDPTYADAILDRLVHNAHRIELSGESLRKTRARPGKGDRPKPKTIFNFVRWQGCQREREYPGMVGGLKSESWAR
jgi:DNA replication protein DnaC